MDLLRPNIFDYLDYRAYLNDFIKYEKSKANFSYSIFAERAGFQSRSFLRTVITGKRNLTANGISKVIVGFGLRVNESEAFRALVYFNQSKNFQDRSHNWELFLKLRPKNTKSKRVDEYYLLARMAYPILLVVLQQEHILNDLKELSRLSNITEKEVLEGLETLCSIGALIKLSDGKYKVPHNYFTTSDDIPNVAIQKFHHNILEKSKDCLNLDPSEREFQSLIFSLNKGEFLYLRERIRSLIEEVEEMFCGSRPRSEKVYAFNLNLIPLTTDFIRNKNNTITRQRSDSDEQTKEIQNETI